MEFSAALIPCVQARTPVVHMVAGFCVGRTAVHCHKQMQQLHVTCHILFWKHLLVPKCEWQLAADHTCHCSGHINRHTISAYMGSKLPLCVRKCFVCQCVSSNGTCELPRVYTCIRCTCLRSAILSLFSSFFLRLDVLFSSVSSGSLSESPSSFSGCTQN